MASRKHCRVDEDESIDASKRVCPPHATDDQAALKYNPSFVTESRTSIKDPGYKVDELRLIARRLGLNPKGMSKVELVAAIRACPLWSKRVVGSQRIENLFHLNLKSIADQLSWVDFERQIESNFILGENYHSSLTTHHSLLANTLNASSQRNPMRLGKDSQVNRSVGHQDEGPLAARVRRVNVETMVNARFCHLHASIIASTLVDVSSHWKLSKDRNA